MKSSEFRELLSIQFDGLNAYYGNNTGSFDGNNYKINYQIISNTLEENCRTYIIDIDIWSKDYVYIDYLRDEIEKMFNYKSISYRSQNNKTIATFYMENSVNADEKDLYRRTISYDVKTYMED